MKSVAQAHDPIARAQALGANGPGHEPPASWDRGDEPLLTDYQHRMIAAGRSAELTLGPYRILDEVGCGGFGRVLKAEHSIMNRVVALKLLPRERPDAQHWLLREVRAATRLTHPNIALAYDANVIDGVLYFAMEFIDGPSLETLVGQRGRLPVDFVCAVIRQAALALQYAHGLGMVHRDIKPANLLLVGTEAEKLLDRPGDPADPAAVLVKVVDFGLARVHPKGTPTSFTIERDLGLFGTPGYIAPEQADNVHDADIRSDLYSLGCTAYFALAGRPPFTGGNTADVIVRQRDKPPKPLELVRPDVPAALVAVVRRLMAPRPEQRFQTPADLLETLAFAQLAWSPTPATTGEDSGGVHAEAGNQAPAESCDADSVGARVGGVAQAAGPGSTGEKVPAAATVCDGAPLPLPVQTGAALPAEDLYELWCRWRDVVEGCARAQPPHLGPEEYKRLHRRLLGAIRAQGDAPQPERRELLARAEELIEPWLSYDALSRLDQRTRADLWQCCLGMDRDLSPGRPNSGRRAWLSLAACCALVPALVILLTKFLHLSP